MTNGAELDILSVMRLGIAAELRYSMLYEKYKRRYLDGYWQA